MRTKKLLFALLAVAVAGIFVGCDDKNEGITDAPDYGDFVFDTNALTVEADDATTSFCLEGDYTVQPDAEVRGQVWVVVSCDDEAAKIFPNFTSTSTPFPTELVYALTKFEEGEDGIFHHEVSFNPADVTAEAKVTYTIINGEYNYYDITPETLASIENKSEVIVTIRPKAE